MRASAFYRSDLWRTALYAARILPAPLLELAGRGLAGAYRVANAPRREIVTRNILPAVQFERRVAKRECAQLYRNFGAKLADLWRYECGKPFRKLVFPEESWTVLEGAVSRKRGCLLLTPHIGNWELGAPFLKDRGIQLHVITQAEPQASLTKLRENSRSRRGVETIVIGDNPFAFVEVIRRLESGATIALLIDRPVEASAITVKLFGEKFRASSAPAILARATGCALLPVVIPRAGSGYSVRMLPEIQYEQRALATPEGRENLTQEMMRQFEPVIREHVNQWFHFVPLWQNDL